MEDNGVEELNEEVHAEEGQQDGGETAPEAELDSSEDQEAPELETVEEAEDEGEGEYKEKYYYLAAEMENMRKRLQRDRENFIKYGNEKILTGLIEVVDNLDRTIDSIADEEDGKIKSIATGIEMVRKQFLEVLKGNGLESVETDGKQFDPKVHEAIAQEESEGKNSEDIIRVYQKGYSLNGRLLRAAKVVVAKG